MKPPHGRPAAEQRAQRVEARQEQRQAAHQEQHEADRHDPVIDARAARVAAHANVLAALFALAGHVRLRQLVRLLLVFLGDAVWPLQQMVDRPAAP